MNKLKIIFFAATPLLIVFFVQNSRYESAVRPRDRSPSSELVRPPLSGAQGGRELDAQILENEGISKGWRLAAAVEVPDEEIERLLGPGELSPDREKILAQQLATVPLSPLLYEQAFQWLKKGKLPITRVRAMEALYHAPASPEKMSIWLRALRDPEVSASLKAGIIDRLDPENTGDWTKEISQIQRELPDSLGQQLGQKWQILAQMEQ